MKFSLAFLKKYAQENLYDRLVTLHELWYEIDLLSRKFSEMAESRKVELTGEFYLLARNIIDEIISGYKDWVYNHEEIGWWERIKEELVASGGVISRWNIDIRPLISKDLFIKYLRMNDEMSWEYVLGENDGADLNKITSFIKETGKEVSEDFTTDYEAYDYIRDNNLTIEYKDWLISKGFLDPDISNYVDIGLVMFEDLYGIGWLKEMKITDENIDVIDNYQDEVWRQWTEHWPNYVQITQQVKDTVEKLYTIQSSNNINDIMSEISLALNVAHNSGLMYENLDLRESQMNSLSSLDMSEVEERVSRYAQKTLKVINKM